MELIFEGIFFPLCYPNAICASLASALKCELPLEASFLLTSHMLRAYILTASPFTSFFFFLNGNYLFIYGCVGSSFLCEGFL